MEEESLDIVKSLKAQFDPKYNKDYTGVNFNITPEVSKPSFYNYSNDTQEMKYATLSDGEKVAKYESYLPGTDNNERLASQQTTGEKWVNGVEKALLKTGNAVVGGTVGLVYGLGSALTEGSFSALYDNDFSNKLADLDTKLGYQLPNYYTKQEQEKGLFGQMGTANFWSDKFLGGLSFTAGAIISEAIWAYATGGTSLATLGVRRFAQGARIAEEGVSIASKASLVARETEAITKYSQTLKNLGLLRAGEISKDTAIAIGKTGEVLSTTGFMLRSAGYEASVEALQYKREAKDNFYRNFESQNGRAPEASEIAEFEKNLEAGANTVFGVNMGILGVSNLAMFGHTFGFKSPINTGIGEFIEKKAFGVGMKKTADGTFKVLEATRPQKIAKGLTDYVLKPGFTEGLFEEGGQGVTTKYNNAWIEHTYDTNKSNQNFDAMGAMYDSVAEQYGTKEGWVENGLGILIGIVGGGSNVYNENKAEKESLEYKASVANTYTDAVLQPLLLGNKIQVANRMQGFSEEAKIEAQNGNLAKSALAQKSAILTHIDAKQTIGEDINDTLNELSQSMDRVTPEQWRKAGITDIATHKEETLAEYKSLSEQWKKNNTYWQYMIGKKLVGEQNLNKTSLESAFGKFNTNTQIVKALAWQSTVGENAHKQMQEVKTVLGRELGEIHANTLVQLEQLRNQDKSVQDRRYALRTRHETLIATRDRLTQLVETLNNAPKETEGNTKQGDRRAKVVADLLRTNTEIEQTLAELETIASNINSANTQSQGLAGVSLDTNLLGSTLTGQDLLDLENNLDKFKSSLEYTKQINPQKYQYLNDLLNEYSQVDKIFRANQATQKVITSSDFKMENIGGWISSKVKGKKAMNENTQEWLQQAIDAYSKSKTDTIANDVVAEDVASNGNVEKEIVDNTIARPRTPKELLEIERQEKLAKVKPTTITTISPNTNGLDVEAKRAELRTKYKLKIVDKGNGFHIQRDGKTISIFDTLQEAEKVLEERIDSLVNSIIIQPINLGNNISVNGVTVDGNTYSVLNVSERMVTIVNIGGVQVPFYLTTGLGGKNLTPSWYPMFGYSQSGWLNKTNGNDMEAYYERLIGKENSDILKSVAEKLNNQFGTTPNSIKQTGIISSGQTYEAVNSVLDFTPAENQKIDASVNAKDELAKLEKNIESIGDRINITPTKSEIAELEKEKAEKLALIEKEINEIEEELRESSKLLEEEIAVEDVEELDAEQKESVIVSNGLTVTKENSSENVTEVIERNNEEVIDNTIIDNLSIEEIATIAQEEEIAVEDVEDFVKEEVRKAIKNKGNILTDLSEATKRIINRIVKFLLGGALIFTVAYSSGNFRNSASKVVSDYITNVTPKDTIAFDESTFSVTGFDGCSAYVSNQVKHTIGKENFKSFGFFGDAWTINDNLVRSGNGTYVFNSFSNFEKKDGIGIEEIRKDVKSAVTTTQSKLKIDMFQEGDIVNLFYEGSNSQQEAYEKGKGSYTSHVGIIKRSADGTLVLEHNIHGIIKKDNLSDLISGKLKSVKGSMLVSGIVRPKYEKIGLTVKKAPTKKVPAQKAPLSGFGLLALLRRRKNGEAITNENINNKQKELEQKLEDLKKQLEDVKSEYDTKIAEKRKQPSSTQTNEPIQQEPVKKTVPNQAEIDKINKEYDAKIKALDNTQSENKIEQYKQRIKDIFKSQQLEYTGDYTDYTEPTQAEIEEFRELNKTVDKGLFTERYNELKDKLSQWKALDSYADQENQTIADLIIILNQLEQEVEQEQTKDEHTQEDIPLTTSGLSESNDFENESILLNMDSHVKVKNPKGTKDYRFSQLYISTIVKRLANSENIPTIKGKEVTIAEIDKMKKGDVLTISGVDFTLSDRGRVLVNMEKFDSLRGDLNMAVLNTKDSNWSYKDLFMYNGVSWVKVPSDFATKEVSQEAMYSAKEGDKVGFQLTNSDGYNLDNYNAWQKAIGTKKEKEAKEYFENQLKIFVVNSKGEVVGILKASSDYVTDTNFLRIKQRAVENFNPALEKTNLMVTTTVSNLYLGSPQVNIVDGQVVNLPFTDKAITQVVATGFMEGEEVTTNRVTEDVDTSFIEKIAKKNPGKQVPFVVVKKGSKNIAYPITMVKKAKPKVRELDSILNQNIEDKDKVIAINNLIQQEQIEIEKLGFADIQDSNKMQEVRTAFENKQTFLSAVDLADSKYKIPNLKTDAQINIDLKDLDNAISDPKIRVSFEDENVIFSEERDVKNNTLTEVENTLNELALELYNDYVSNADTKYLDSKGNILEDTLYTDTFDESPIEKVTSQLAKIGNINILKRAFSAKLPKIVENALGADKVREVKNMIKQYDFILKQTIVKPGTAQNGANNIC